MSVPDATTDTARRDWYRSAIQSDPGRRERFERAVRKGPEASVPDDLDEIDRILGDDAF